MTKSLIKRIKRLEDVIHVEPERYYVELIGAFFGPYSVFTESTYESLLQRGKRFNEMVGPFDSLREARVWCLEDYGENFPKLFQETLRHNSVEELLDAKEWKHDMGIIFTKETFARDAWPAENPDLRVGVQHSTVHA